MKHPDPTALHPIAGVSNTVQLKPLLAKHPDVTNVSVGEYSYYSDFDDPTAFFQRNVRYNFGYSGSKLVIGKFCALAHGTAFIMDDANHCMAGPSTFPFPVFGGSWAESLPLCDVSFPTKGDIVVGHDVWFGYESLVMPGVKVGSGAVVAARAVVSRDVPPYAVVAGNPARIVRMRYTDAEVEQLLTLAWWNWPPEMTAKAVPLLVAGKISALEELAAGITPPR